jgi:hypothetical protein
VLHAEDVIAVVTSACGDNSKTYNDPLGTIYSNNMRYLAGLAIVVLMVAIPILQTANAAPLTDEQVATMRKQAASDAAFMGILAGVGVSIFFGIVILIVFYMVYKNAT